MQQAIRAAKDAAPDLLVITDVCFCEYTDHGHCGVIDDHTGRMDVNNDATLELLGKQAVSHAKAGADLVAPSGMMDGMVGAIRTALDGERLRAPADHELRRQVRQQLLRPVSRSGREHAEIRRPARLSDGPRRRRGTGAARSRTRSGRRGRHHHGQAGPRLSRHHPPRPATAFPACRSPPTTSPANTAMVKAAAERGWIDEQAVALESLTAITRAGASIILTYWAKDVARWLN